MITPAGRAGVYTLKLTPDSANTDGICKITIGWDTIGGFAKTVKELAILSDLLLDTGGRAEEVRPLTESLREDFKGLRVGFVDPEKRAIEDDAREADSNFPGEIVSPLSTMIKEPRAANAVPRNRNSSGLDSLSEKPAAKLFILLRSLHTRLFFHEGQPLQGSITSTFKSLDPKFAMSMDETDAAPQTPRSRFV